MPLINWAILWATFPWWWSRLCDRQLEIDLRRACREAGIE